MKSYVEPTDSEVEEAVPLLSSPQHEAYFFSRLENPHWILPLSRRKIFSFPPAAEGVEGGGLRFPPWPQSTYLVRMADQAPRDVAAVFELVNTDNATVLGDVFRAALAMPSDVGVSLVPTIRRLAPQALYWFHYKDASSLCAKLLEAGEAKGALKLAFVLFDISGGRVSNIAGEFDSYWYLYGLGLVLPGLAKAMPAAFLPRLCDWLKTLAESAHPFDPESGLDASTIWRPAIEDHEQNSDHDLAGTMVGLVRDGFEHAVRSGNMTLAQALQIVRRYRNLIYGRLRVHLIAEFSEHDPQLARETMMNRTLFDDGGLKHEYAILAGRRFPLLTEAEQRTWFSWIDNGPELSDFERRFEQYFGRRATEADREKRRRYWQYEKLHWVRSHLDGDRREFYDEMLETEGEPELADLHIRMGRALSGSESPISVDDMAARPFAETVKLVSAWRPDGSEFMGPSIKGLALRFGQYVATNPEAYSAEARCLIGKPAVFVRTFIAQMADAAAAGRGLALAPVFDLSRWVVDRPMSDEDVLPEEAFEAGNRDWQWTRDGVSGLIESVCKARANGSPKFTEEGIGATMGDLLLNLCQDRDRSYVRHDTAADDPRVHDYLNLAINSPRGKALEAMFEYALWLAVKDTRGATVKGPRAGFDEVPVVREILEWQISPGNRSVEALAIIGSRVGLIQWLDDAWLERNAARVFDLEGIQRSPADTTGWSAWNAYLVWVSPQPTLFDVLQQQYQFAITQAAELPTTIEQGRGQPMNHLGEHLMALFGGGHIDLTDRDGPLFRFMESANPNIRRHAIGFVGSSLEAAKSIPAEAQLRFMRLWDHYWPDIGRSDAQQEPGAYLFGTWFASAKFPNPWALERLEQFAEIVSVPMPDHSVLQRLQEIARSDIDRSVRIVNAMVRSAKQRWRIYGWREHLEPILELGLKASSAETESRTVALINHLGRMGFHEYGEILLAPA